MLLMANKLKNIKLSWFSLLAIYPTSYNNFPAIPCILLYNAY